ncbi:MAG: flagellar filament capping protein FliD [Spongiibacteraceae bacterium]
MATITSVGTGSNIDLEGLIKQVVDAERTPAENRITLKETTLNANISALGSLKSALSDFQATLTKLKSSTFFNARTAVASDSTLISATATSSADAGAHTIEVLDMAKANKVASGNFAGASTVVGNGTLNISVGAKSFDVAITAGQNDTLAGIRDAINNAEGNTGVRASILTVSDGGSGTVSKLVLTSSNTGVSNAITVAVTGDGDTVDNDNAGLSQLISANLSEIDPAQDASITVDGFAVTSSSNQISGAIEGVTINVLKEDPNNVALSSTLTIGIDKSGVKAAVQDFVANYNALVTVFNTLTNYDATTQTRGLLSGDSSVSVMESRIRRIMTSVVSSAPEGLNSLADLGISTNRDGSIALDDTKLSSALSANFDSFDELFTGDNGIASRLDKLATELTGSGGVFSTRETSINEQLSKLDEQKDELNTRLTKLEARYRAQFSALDILVSQLNQTGSFLTQQLDATAQIINGKN